MFSGRLPSTITFRPKCTPISWLYKAYSTGTQATSSSHTLSSSSPQASTSSSSDVPASSSSPARASGSQPTRLFVAKIHKSVTDSDIKAAFGDVAGIIRKRLNTGYAFVDFKTHTDARRVLQAHAEVPIVLRGTALRVEMSEQGVTPNHVPTAEGNPGRKLVIPELPLEYEHATLMPVLEQWGEVETLKISRPKFSKHKTAIITYRQKADAARAYANIGHASTCLGSPGGAGETQQLDGDEEEELPQLGGALWSVQADVPLVRMPQPKRPKERVSAYRKLMEMHAAMSIDGHVEKGDGQLTGKAKSEVKKVERKRKKQVVSDEALLRRKAKKDTRENMELKKLLTTYTFDNC